MNGISDGFGISDLRRLSSLHLPVSEKWTSFCPPTQVKYVVTTEKQLNSQLALISNDGDNAMLLMTIPASFTDYPALRMVAEIGGIRRSQPFG